MSDILIKGMKMPIYDGVYPCRLIIERGEKSEYHNHRFEYANGTGKFQPDN